MKYKIRVKNFKSIRYLVVFAFLATSGMLLYFLVYFYIPHPLQYVIVENNQDVGCDYVYLYVLKGNFATYNPDKPNIRFKLNPHEERIINLKEKNIKGYDNSIVIVGLTHINYANRIKPYITKKIGNNGNKWVKFVITNKSITAFAYNDKNIFKSSTPSTPNIIFKKLLSDKNVLHADIAEPVSWKDISIVFSNGKEMEKLEKTGIVGQGWEQSIINASECNLRGEVELKLIYVPNDSVIGTWKFDL